ncbi:MAG: hypothetical protein V7709_12945 [Halioglobus sp.]
MRTIYLAVFVIVLAITACSKKEVSAPDNVAAADAPSDAEQVIARAQAPLLDGMGDFDHPITTSDPWAQRYFNQGIALASGFNHAESIRAFKAAQRLDPNCAMCYWGEALATGPNINVTSKGKAIMSPADRISAHAAIGRASDLASSGTDREKDLIAAQRSRYNGDPETDREPLDSAYAEAMRELAAKYPEDDDIQAMYAEALMNTMPWDYWLDGDNPRPDTAAVIAALESVIQRNPSHPLSLHLYIHAVEASSNPGRAEKAADLLGKMVPGSGHLVHMPSHIYWRIGRYYDASEANVMAAAVDEKYIAQCNAQGFYPAMYYPHNIHFLWASASMEGRSAVAIEAGRKVAANVRLEQIQEFPTVEFFQTVPLLSLVRFAHWDEILAEPQPPAELKFSQAIWHYARSIAFTRTRDLEAAEAELAAMSPLLANESIWFLDGNDYPASQILGIAEQLGKGELALAREDYSSAITHFTKAVEGQEALPYTEPPFWYYPTRQSLGHALLVANKPAKAEAVFRDDLKQYPRNGWSILGLSLSLEGQGKTAEAEKARSRFEKIWERADVELTSSVL